MAGTGAFKILVGPIYLPSLGPIQASSSGSQKTQRCTIHLAGCAVDLPVYSLFRLVQTQWDP